MALRNGRQGGCRPPSCLVSVETTVAKVGRSHLAEQLGPHSHFLERSDNRVKVFRQTRSRKPATLWEYRRMTGANTRIEYPPLSDRLPVKILRNAVIVELVHKCELECQKRVLHVLDRFGFRGLTLEHGDGGEEGRWSCRGS
jgi:hypothetical protein